ncbi:DUF5979 domain-containing protein, partial [Propionicimonas sp.]|uniref:DUF5979 domain-containing protein n=1 Tax=Propionicimonas sp. TaxID=1955623 RepID=UPI0039E704CC
PSGIGSGGVTVTGDSQHPTTVGVVDNFITATLVVTKRVLGDGAGAHARFPFTFAVTCTLAEDGVDTPHDVFDTTFSLSVADGLVSDPLGPVPVGADCTVTETGTGGATIAADPAEVTIAEGGSAVTMSNTFDVGSVVVTKAITVDGEASDAEPYASGSYTVTLSCTALVDGVAEPVTIPGGAIRTITGAGSVEYTGLPLGASCAAAETGSSLAIPSDQVSVGDEVIVGANPSGITVTNDFRTGSLVLNWAVTGVGRQFAGPATFSVDCTLEGAAGWTFHQTVTLDPNGVGARTLAAATDAVATAAFSPIPVGAHCEVTQTDAAGADHLSSVVVATGTVELQADVVNEYSAGTLTITKQVKGADAAAHTHTRFLFTVTCVASGGTTSYSGVVSIVGAGSTTIAGDDGQPLLFPAGTSCWATESGTGGADEHSVDHDSASSALSVFPGRPDTVQELVITAVNTFADPGHAGSGNLAYTGFAGGGLAVLGLAFLAAGAWLVRRRRA